MITKEKFLEKLNNDLSNEFSAIIQYITYAAKIKGPFRPELAKFFINEVADEQQHAQFLADKIVSLGGMPIATASPVADASSAKDMLKEVFKAESRAVSQYKERAKEAEELGFKALAIDLEDMIRDETKHREEVEKILSGWEF